MAYVSDKMNLKRHKVRSLQHRLDIHNSVARPLAHVVVAAVAARELSVQSPGVVHWVCLVLSHQRSHFGLSIAVLVDFSRHRMSEKWSLVEFHLHIHELCAVELNNYMSCVN